jgi:chromosome segregation ATPase
MVNTDTLVDDTNKQGQVPASEYRREEALRVELAYLKDQLKKKEITEKKFKEQHRKIELDIAKFQKQLEEAQIRELKQRELVFMQQAKKQEELKEKSYFFGRSKKRA